MEITSEHNIVFMQPMKLLLFLDDLFLLALDHKPAFRIRTYFDKYIIDH